ncbi:MAG: DegQ family serine endoprotease [Gemmatimonadota bacterium]|nr:DegQ family serine endoprotease [Gemmatimonadota bacterium]
MKEKRKFGGLAAAALLVTGMVLGALFISNWDASVAERDVYRSITPVVAADQRSLEDFSETFATIAERVKPSVVLIKSQRVARQTQQRFWSPWEEFFGGGQPRNDQPRQFRGVGSGVIVSADGYILTNNHVVENADELKVQLSDEREVKAEIIGLDPRTDLAVIKVDFDDLPALAFGDSEKLRVGEWVMAVGNPFGLNHSVTAGIVSAKGRGRVLPARPNEVTYENFIQTDAAINPGNSGGALVDMEGSLMGINTAIYTRTGGYQGIGFAVPANMARNIMTRLVEDGRVTRGYLGVRINNLDAVVAESMGLEDSDGVLIEEITDDGPARDSDLQREDVVVALNGENVEDTDDLRYRIADIAPGTEVELEVIRDGAPMTVTIELGELPGDEATSTATREEPQRSPASNLGIDVMDVSRQWSRFYEQGSGVVIAQVRSGSVAEDKNLQRGDLIREVNGDPVSSVQEFLGIVRQFEAGQAIRFRIQRGDAQFLVGLRIPEE